MDALLKKYAFEVGKFFNTALDRADSIRIARLFLKFLVDYVEGKNIALIFENESSADKGVVRLNNALKLSTLLFGIDSKLVYGPTSIRTLIKISPKLGVALRQVYNE